MNKTFGPGAIDFNPLAHPICLVEPHYVPFSAWLEHIPFAMYLVDLLKPRTLVELGTHYGASYCAFCQAVRELSLDTRCCAVDSWEGDPHSGTYGPDVLARLRAYHDPLYGGFSRLIHSRFDDALSCFADGSIDLLHIDGYHTYDAVRHDFERWRPKVSTRGVILLHDTNARQLDFGVWRFWEEIRSSHPSFEFLHCHGLGVLAVGAEVVEGLRPLLAAGERETALIRQFFFARGHPINLRHRMLPETEARAVQAEQALRQHEADRAKEAERTHLLSDALAREEDQSQRLSTDLKRHLQVAQELVCQCGHEFRQLASRLIEEVAAWPPPPGADPIAATITEGAGLLSRYNEVFRQFNLALTGCEATVNSGPLPVPGSAAAA
jgi:hypothetical protein